jgi:hypothetical protein
MEDSDYSMVESGGTQDRKKEEKAENRKVVSG